MTVAIFILVLMLLLCGLLGTLLIILPGIPLMFFTVLAYAIFDHFQRITGWNILFFAVLTAISLLIDYFSGIMGAKFFGASRYGTLGGIAGGLIGLFIFPPFGIFIGMFLGVIISELAFSKRTPSKSLRSGTGALLGSVLGILTNFAIGIVFIASFIVLYWN